MENTNNSNDYDSPWKEALEHYFPQFMALLFPQAHAQINWEKPHEFLDKELQQIVRDAESGRSYTDKLVKVVTLNDETLWVLIHIEIQGKADAQFNHRMYRYHYRLHDRYPEQALANFAVLTNQKPSERLGHYQHDCWQTELSFRFPVIYLQHWQDRQDELEAHPNLFAVVILAQLMAHQTTHDDLTRKDSKFRLIRSLYQRRYDRQDILELFRYIDWMLQLPETLEQQLIQDIEQIEQEEQMTYVTAIERFAEKRGEARGEARGKIKGEAQTLHKQLRLKFNDLPDWVEEKINQADKAQLDQWVERILFVNSLDDLFKP